MKEETKPHYDHPIIFFDGVCNLCESSVQFTIKHDKKEIFLFAQLQSVLAEKLLDKHASGMKSVVLYENNQVYTKSTAALRIARKLNGWPRLLWGFIILPKFIRDFFYDIIANKRYKWFGQKEECMIPTPELNSRFV